MSANPNSLRDSNFSGPSVEIDYESLNFDIEELDVEEYQIPTVLEPPTLESILNETDDGLSFNDLDSVPPGGFLEPGPETQSLASQRSRSGERKKPTLLSAEAGSETLSVTSQRSFQMEKKKRMSTGIVRHVLLKGISAQLTSAAERVEAGSATVVAVGGLLALGTSRGLTLIFDARQVLRLVLQCPDSEQGSVSCLSFNADSTRLLVGFARGLILMFDLNSGNLLRSLTDVHPPNSAVLSLKFTDLPNLALCADSGGSVFELSFTRLFGVRGCDTRCIFSGSRGEVTTMSPLLLNGLGHPLESSVLVAMATLTKVIVVSIRPKLRVILVRPLPVGSSALPLIAWHLVSIHNGTKKVIDPVLACAKGNTVSFYQVSIDRNGKLLVSALQKLVVNYSLLALHWMNSWMLALLDTSERLHLVEVNSHAQLETSDLSSVGLVYESSHFKAIFTGGNVSKAMAQAGEKACYNTVVSYGGQLLLLGGKSLHALTIRPWKDRIDYLVNQNKFSVALDLALSFHDEPKSVTGLRGSKEARQGAVRGKVVEILRQFAGSMTTPTDDIPVIVEYAITFKALDVLFSCLWDGIYLDQQLKSIFLFSLEPYILSDQLSSIPPTIFQSFVSCYEQAGKLQALEACILHVDIASMDLHLIMTVAKNYSLYDAFIYIHNQALGDYTSPLQDLLPILHDAITSGRKLTGIEVELGNKLLVYVSCCLAGRGYPVGDIPRDTVQIVKHDVFKWLTCLHSKNGDDNEQPYPYLRTLLQFDTREFFNVVSLAFTEPEFTTELGLTLRQRVVNILFQIMVDTSGFSASQIGMFFTFLARQLSRPASGLQLSPLKFHPVFENLTEPNAENREERQQTLLELLRAAGLQNYDKDALLERARAAGFIRVCEEIYEQCGEWDQVFKCYLEDPRRRSQVFSFLRNIFLLSRGTLLNKQTKKRVLLDAVQKHIQDLLALDVNLTGSLIVTNMLECLDDILLSLPDDQKLSLVRAALFSKSEYEDDHRELHEKYFPLYLDLTVRLEPKNTVAALIKNINFCDSDEILDLLRVSGHSEGYAFLLERRGEYNKAFLVLNERISNILESASESGVADLEGLLKSAVRILQRPKTEDLWTDLLDTILSKSSEISAADKTKILKLVLSGSAGFSNPSTILNFLLRHSAYSGATFGDLRNLFTGMLEDSRYEATIAATTKTLVFQSLHTQLQSSLKSARRAVRPVSDLCSVCGSPFQRTAVVVFPCGHPVHDRCSNTCQCPTCAIIALDRVPTLPRPVKDAEEAVSAESMLKLKVAARPVSDLERLC